MIKKTTSIIRWISSKLNGYRLSMFLITILLTVVSLSSIGIAIVSKQLVDAATSDNADAIYGLIIVYSVLVLGKILIGAINKLFDVSVWNKFSVKLRIDLYQNIVKSYWLDFTKIHSGDYITRITTDVSSFTSGIINDIPMLLASIIKFIVAFAVLAYYQPLISLFTFIFLPLTFLITRIYNKRLRTSYKAIQKIDSEINARFQEYFYNIQMLKVYDLEEITSKVLEDILIKKKEYIIKNTKISNRINMIKSIGTWGGYCIAYTIGIVGIFEGTISFGVLIVFLQLFNEVQRPLFEIASSVPRMIQTVTAAERLIGVEEIKSEKDLYSDKMTLDLPTEIPKRLSIELHDVSFSYSHKEKQLDHVSLLIEAGELTLIVGKSGSGKTTMLRLLLSLLLQDSGEINFVNHQHISYCASPSLRKWCAYVSQDNCIFSGSIESNVKYGHEHATNDEVVAALVNAEAWEFVSELDDGIQSIVGERGTGISGGQAQRLAIARALVSQSAIIIFDEATSGLDVETETKIMENIKKSYSHKTFIIVSHRDGIRKYADKVFALEHGKVRQEV